jgi:uncharacterized membrane protein
MGMKVLTSLGMIIGYALTVVGFWQSEENERKSFWWSLGMLIGVIILFLSVLLFCVPGFFKS